MTWIRENKFLTVFFALLFVGIVAFGYLLYTASGSYSDVSDKYNQQAAELRRLQNLAPYPDQENLRKMREDKDAYAAKVTQLQKGLAAQEFPLEPLTPEQFQDRLRSTVSQVVGSANASGVKLPEKFYMGFDVYQTSLPKAAAAAPLGRQLRAIEFVVRQLFEAKVGSLVTLSRTPLPEEGGAPAPGAAPASGGGGRGGRGRGPVAAASEKSLVSKSTFEIAFITEQPRFRKWINDISSAKEQFYIVRLFTVKNENPAAPLRVDNSVVEPTPAAAAPQPAAAAAAPNGKPSEAGGGMLKFIVGTEKIAVTAKVEILDFSAPESAQK